MTYKCLSIKKYLCIFLLFFVHINAFAQQAFSFDFDGKIGMEGSQYDYTSNNRIIIKPFLSLSLEGRIPLSMNDILYVRTSGWVSYDQYKNFQGHLQDLVLDVVIGEYQNIQLNILLGRQFFSDPSEIIVAQHVDGLYATLKTNNINAGLGIGYLGFLPATQNNIRLNNDDEEEKNNTDWGTAPPRLLALGNINFSLTSSIFLGAHLGGQFDLRETPTSFNIASWYIGTHSNGIFLSDLLEYTAQLTISGGHYSIKDSPVVGFFISNHWSFTFPSETKGSVSLGIDVTSGDADGGFITISKVKQGNFFKEGIDDLFMFSWITDWYPFTALNNYTWLHSLRFYIEGKHFWNTAPNELNISIPKDLEGLTANSGEAYGHEISLGFSTTPSSDFRLKAIMGGMFDNKLQKEALLFSSIIIEILF